MQEYGTAKTIIEVMNNWGIEHLFFNPGIDNTPVLETLARFQSEGTACPRSILCLDEFVAMTAAHGHYMASGKPQAVSVHSELGVLQIGGSLHNAQWGRVPVVFFTENQGPQERRTWQGDKYDQCGMVRNFVKWDHQVSPGENIADVFNEAFRIASTEPCGPVYINMPRSAFWDDQAEVPTPPIKLHAPVPDFSPVLKDVAAALLNAANPLIVTGYAGRHQENTALLTELAELVGAQVLTSDIRVNVPTTHPLCAQLSPVPEGRAHPLTEADVILAIDFDMHYASPPLQLQQDAVIIHIDIDTAKKGLPLWDRKPRIILNGDSRSILPLLLENIKAHTAGGKQIDIKNRIKRYSQENSVIRNAWQTIAQSHNSRQTISAEWLSWCINQVIKPEDIIVNQTISPANIVAHLVERTVPGSLLSCAGGCIGWAPGGALGVKLASPDKTVISLMGDGAFIYGCPEASLYASWFYQAPYLSIIFNNQGYGAIKGLFKNRYEVENMGADIPEPPDYAGIARSCHAFGMTVKEPAGVKPALEQCLQAVSEGHPAVLDVWIDAV